MVQHCLYNNLISLNIIAITFNLFAELINLFAEMVGHMDIFTKMLNHSADMSNSFPQLSTESANAICS